MSFKHNCLFLEFRYGKGKKRCFKLLSKMGYHIGFENLSGTTRASYERSLFVNYLTILIFAGKP